MFLKNLLKNYTFLILSLLVFLIQPAYSFVHSMNDYGKKIKWGANVSNVKFHFNSSSDTFQTSNSQNSVNTVLVNSAAQWNGVGTHSVSTERVTNQVDGRNDIYFDKSGFLDDTNILGLTQVIFETTTGTIVEADIILNDAYQLNLIENDSFFVGNVLTHEIGHAMGLSHSEVGFSSMFYLASTGQFEISHDDHSAVATLYNKDSVNVLKGRVVGGNSNGGLFGIHVIVYDGSSGEIVASTVTTETGRFTIRDLDPNKDYTILTSPIKNKELLPDYFQNANYDFCIGQIKFQKTFWQGCGASEEGHPVSVLFQEENVETYDLGDISVRCNLDTPIDYSLDRDTVDGFHLSLSKWHNRFVGIMTLDDIKNTNADNILIDLSNEDLPIVEAGEQLYLDINVANQELYSMLKVQTKVVFSDFSQAVFGATDLIDSDHTFKSDVGFRLSLDSGISEDNIFKFEIRGKNFKQIQYGSTSLDGYINDTNLTPDIEQFFPDEGNLSETSLFYLFNARVVKRKADGTIVDLGDRAETFERFDNGTCTDAPLSYRSFPIFDKSEIGVASGSVEASEDEGITDALGGCGTIGGPNTPGGPGSGTFLLSLVMGVALAMLGQIKYRQI